MYQGIKFRAWDKERSCFYYSTQPRVDFIFGKMGDGVYINNSLRVDLTDENTSRFTGLKDKNGVDIYEGDIVRCKVKDARDRRRWAQDFISPVFWDCLSWTVSESPNCDDGLARYDSSNPTKLPMTTIEAIGNIHENPELLKREDQPDASAA